MKLTIQEYLVKFRDGEEASLIKCDKEKDLWKIESLGFVIDKNLKWIHEPFPSSRTKKHLDATRFTYKEAESLLLQWENK